MTTAVLSASDAGRGPGFRGWIKSQMKPTTLEANESASQEKVMTKRTTNTHSSTVVVPTPTTLYI